MKYYITYGDYQNQINEYYHRTGLRMTGQEAANYLYIKGLLLSDCPKAAAVPGIDRQMDSREFSSLVDAFYFPVHPHLPVSKKSTENEMIPEGRDAFLIRHPRNTRVFLHQHDYYELNYAAYGSCILYFEDQMRTMHSGDLYLLSPGSRHDIQVENDAVVYSIMIRKSSLPHVFSNILSSKDLLALFFNSTYQNSRYPDYLSFHVNETETKGLEQIFRNILTECCRSDVYSNFCCVNWVHLLFSHLLRSAGHTMRRYNAQVNPDFAHVLQYIQKNYQTVTLSSLSAAFHYSEPHLCTLIKQNCGQNFTEMVKQLRMTEALKLLNGTDMKINEIADRIGYNSADHFSRVFRQNFGLSPQEYKRTHQIPETQMAASM